MDEVFFNLSNIPTDKYGPAGTAEIIRQVLATAEMQLKARLAAPGLKLKVTTKAMAEQGESIATLGLKRPDEKECADMSQWGCTLEDLLCADER